MYLAVKYRDFSVIFYNSQFDDMIAVTSELFHSVVTVFYRLLHMLLHFILTFSAAKRDVNTTEMKCIP